MATTFKDGKKYVAGVEVRVKHRLTCFGSDGNTIYTATLWADGEASCNCPAWRFERKGKRGCKHATRAMTLTADVDETGGLGRTAAAAEPDLGTTPFKRRTRSVDT
jgi:hypothetical protein